MCSLTSGENVSHNLKLSLTSVREAVAWIVSAVSIVLFVVSLTVNITIYAVAEVQERTGQGQQC